MVETILEIKKIEKCFGNVKALKDINMKVIHNHVHALVGENGAGKSTLMNVLSGVYPFGSYSGEIYFENKLCKFKDIKSSENKGIVIIHQELALVPELTIAENMFLGNERKNGLFVDWNKTEKEAEKYLKMVGIDDNPDTLIKNIGIGKQQLVEIAKALAKNAKLLILDEPTASLNEKESQKLLDLLLKLKKQGLTSIIISHKLNEISYVADEITIIRDGQTIETISKNEDEFSEERIIRKMVGREISDRYPKRNIDVGEVFFEVKNMTVCHPTSRERVIIDNVSFYAKKGEIIGISGLVGAGRTELALSIFGKSYSKNVRGDIIINNNKVEINDIESAIKNKIAYVTEDRKEYGVFLQWDLIKNITASNIKKVSSHGMIDEELEYDVADKYQKMFVIKCGGIDQKVENLSGGNQQKVLISKWLFTDPQILILDEPTRGIDVGAKYEIYSTINELAAAGKTIIMISSDMSEILGMSDRIYVMDKGKIVGELDRETATSDKIMALIIKENEV